MLKPPVTADTQTPGPLVNLLQNTASTTDITEAQYSALITSIAKLYQTGQLHTLVPVLPLLLKLKGKAFSLVNHFIIEPLFSLHPPRSFVLKAARQISKSTSLAAQRCIHASLIPYFSSLYVAPRFEQARRFSNNYVKPFLSDSPIGQVSLNKEAEQSVLQRTFKNGSLLHFSFAFLDADRTRGISADSVSFDEVQDIDTDFIPIITETLSHSEYDLRQYTGTPKTMDNTLQLLWDDSSQAEWLIKCSCGYWNIASIDHDLLQMIQVLGPSCAHCGKLIDPATGMWQHRYPDRRISFAGYHASQPIMPMHYRVNPKTGLKDRWNQLVIAKNSMDKATFYNEKLGESCDVRVSLVTLADLRSASVLTHTNTIRAAVPLRDEYVTCTMGIDWGGGGKEGMSYTKVAILGHRPDFTSDLLYGECLLNYPSPVDEARYLIWLSQAFNCHLVGHDFGGAGALRETLMIQAGFDIASIFPASYVGTTAAAMVTHKPPTGFSTRSYYSVDKARSLVLLCQLIKQHAVRFPKFETWSTLAEDFLALVEDRRDGQRGPDIYLITRKANKSDDFAHAVNFALLPWWHTQRHYPNLAAQLGLSITPEQEAMENPTVQQIRQQELGLTE